MIKMIINIWKKIKIFINKIMFKLFQKSINELKALKKGGYQLTQEETEQLCDDVNKYMKDIDLKLKRQLVEGKWKKFIKEISVKKMRKFNNLINKYNQIVREYK